MPTISTILILLMSFFVIQPPSMAIAATSVTNEFMLLYSNNVNGETEPCG